MSGNRNCGSCAAEIGSANLCLACGWTGCDEDDHEWKSQGDPSVGIPWHCECKHCGLTDDEDASGHYDDYDFDDDSQPPAQAGAL